MSSEEVLTLNRLPSEIQETIKNKGICAKKRLPEWLAFLNLLAQFDAQVDESSHALGKRILLCGFLLFATLFISIFALGMSGGNDLVGIGGGSVFVIVLLVFIVSIVKRMRLNKINLDDSFRATLLPVLDLLAEDIAPKGNIALELKLGYPAASERMLSERQLPPGRNKKLIERRYRAEVLHAVIPLSNGIRLLLDIVKQPVSYDRYYKNPRGKHKHKKKWKMLTLVTAGVIPAGEDFAINAAAVEKLAATEKVKLKEKWGEQFCCLTRKIKTKSESGIPQEQVAPEQVVAMFMRLCSMLKRAE